MAMCDDVKYMSYGINLVGVVERKGETRNVNTRYGPAKVSNAFLRDETGVSKLTLWGHDTTKIKNGDKIEVKNGYVTIWNGVRSLDAGFRGSIHIISNEVEQPKQTQQPTDLASDIGSGIYVEYEDDALHDDGLVERIKQDRQLWRESLA